MGAKQEILAIPQALRAMLDSDRAEYEGLVRRTHWGDGPVYIVGGGSSEPSGLFGAYAFESLLGWSAVVRTPAMFRSYALSVLRPSSVLLLISSGSDSEESLLEIARAARSRGATILVLTGEPASPVVRLSDGVFPLRTSDQRNRGLASMVCRQAALGLIALTALLIFKRYDKQAESLAKEFEGLPERVEWAFIQLDDALQQLASALMANRELQVVGGGFYHPVALQAAGLLRRMTGLPAAGFEPSEFCENPAETLGGETGAVFLCGTRCRLKDEIHAAARRAGKAGVQIYSITDSNDGALVNRSHVAVLLPVLSEMVGSTLALALFEQAVCGKAERGGRFDPKPIRKVSDKGAGERA